MLLSAWALVQREEIHFMSRTAAKRVEAFRYSFAYFKEGVEWDVEGKALPQAGHGLESRVYGAAVLDL